MSPQIGIVLGSYSDVKLMKPGMERLKKMQVSFEMCIASAHRTPERLERWLADAEARGVQVIVAGAGMAAHLPGVVASKTLLPVVGVPFDASPLHGQDALLSIIQMPPGIPVATVGINGSENGVILALEIVALNDISIREKLRVFRDTWKEKIEEQNRKLYEEFPEAKPSDVPSEATWGIAEESDGFIIEDQEISEEIVVRVGRNESVSIAPKTSSSSNAVLRRKVDPDSPDVAVIEEAVDRLLGGGIVALPTDTVYGVAADATNQHAVQKLYLIKDRDPKKPIPILVDSIKMFRQLVRDIPPEAEEIIDRFWPGPLTLIARRRGGMLESAVLGETVGVRMPDNMVALSIINMLSRPLATTSANISGHFPADTAAEVARQIGNNVDLILDTGKTSGKDVSTVLSIVEKPFTILRSGSLSREALQEVLGDLLA